MHATFEHDIIADNFIQLQHNDITELPIGLKIGGIDGPTDSEMFITQIEGLNLTVCMHYILLSSSPEMEPALAGFFGTITTCNGTALGRLRIIGFTFLHWGYPNNNMHARSRMHNGVLSSCKNLL